MRTEPLAAILTNDLVAHTRGRAVPQSAFQKYLVSGSGWVPANLALDPFGRIITPNPFGSVGDLKMIPDPASVSSIEAIDGNGPTTMVLSDIVTPDGQPWDCCPRTFLREALADFERETGLNIVSSFEHEFMLRSPNRVPGRKPFSLESLLTYEPMGSRMMAALEDAGLDPEMWLPEFADQQWEVTLKPADALTAADRAIYLREVVRNVTRNLGLVSTMSPIVEANGGGNGVHIHVSLRDAEGNFVTHDPQQPGGLSDIAGSFAAGILDHAEALSALAASSVVSYERLAPNRWSVGGIFLGKNNREALLRICPLFDTPGAEHQKQFNLEFRGADATSNPWLVLGALVRAGLDGIRRQLPAPTVVEGDISTMDPEKLAAASVGSLPTTLEEALERLLQDDTVTGWLSPDLLATFLAVKRAEIEYVDSLSDAARYDAYASAY